MGENSKIEWCDHTMNFWIGCQEVSPACDHCYARVQNEHWKWVRGWGPDGERRRTSLGNWNKLRIWNRRAKESGVRAKVFCNSLSDFFDNYREVSVLRQEAWHYIDQASDLDFLILTKRPQNIPKMLPDPETGVKPWGDGWPNVWLGTTVENQEEADRRIPHLLKVPAAVHFLSCEPLLGPVDLGNIRPSGRYETDALRGFDFDQGLPVDHRIGWIICGGESGPHVRAMNPEWARLLRDQCAEAGVPFFFKQWGEWLPEDDAYDRGLKEIEGGPPESGMYRVGKKRAGAMLDGREWRQFPRGSNA